MHVAEMAPHVRKSELANLQLLIDSIPALIHSGRPDGTLDFFNQRWLNYVGVSVQDLWGWKWTAVINPERGSIRGTVARGSDERRAFRG